MASDLSVVLDLVDAAGHDTVGGKAASLGDLIRAGFPVPPGFCVTTAVYRRYLDHVGRHTWAAGPPAARFDQPLPAELAAPIAAAYAALGDDVAVAVRSSATAEDLPDASFAGQQDTFLNVRGAAAVLAAVRACWASLWNERAVAYRARAGAAPDAGEPVGMAVVVQPMVPAEAAGVVFTVDPATGDPDRLVINSAWGLGEAVVAGAVTPDVLVLTRDGTIVDRHVADKTAATVLADEGTTTAPVPEAHRRQPSLTDGQALALADLSRRIAAAQGSPGDVEWARVGDRLYVLQARPITTSTAERETWNDSLTGDFLWTDGNFGEALPDVMTPCTWSLAQRFVTDVLSATTVGPYRPCGNIGGRLYLNYSVVVSLTQALGMPRKVVLATLERVFGRIPDDLDLPRVKVSRLAVLRAVLPGLWRTHRLMPDLPAWLASSPHRCDDARARIAATADPASLRRLWIERIGPMFRVSNHMFEAANRARVGRLSVLGSPLTALVGEADAAALVSGIDDRSSGGLASMGPLRGLLAVRRGELSEDDYARTWGHRGPSEFEVAEPRPAENRDWIRAHAQALSQIETQMSARVRAQRAATDAAWARLRARHPRRARSVAKAVEIWREIANRREHARSEAVRMFWVLRAFVLRAGELAGCADSIFMLSIEEILDVLAGGPAAAAALARIPARTATYAHYRALPTYPHLIVGPFHPERWAADPRRRTDRFVAGDRAHPAGRRVTGFAGNAGVVVGVARVVDDPARAGELRAGEVLVTTVTNVGWTPVFPRVAAVVTDVGAPLSHAAIVARELGLPAVVGCGDATMVIRTGDRVRVDGGAGTVDVLERASSGPRAGD